METGIPTATPPNHYHTIPAKEWVEFYQPLEQKYRELQKSIDNSKLVVTVRHSQHFAYPAKIFFIDLDLNMPVQLSKDIRRGLEDAFNNEYRELLFRYKAPESLERILSANEAEALYRRIDKIYELASRAIKSNDRIIQGIPRFARWLFRIKKIKMDE